jgi:segregation and condensation protein B
MSITETENDTAADNEEAVSETASPEETAVAETSPEEASPEAAVPETEAAEGETSNDDLRLIEALLFASTSPLDEASIKERLPEGTDVRALIADLTALYAPRGVNIVLVAGGWTIRTAPDLAPRMKLTQKVGRKLSRAAIETLAVVAYHQPVTRAEIEEIRGVVISKGTLDTLMEAGWIVPKGRKQTVGRPVTWVTTEDFLLHFGLARLGDLPGIDELRATGLIGARPVATLSETIGLPEDSALPPVPGDNDDSDEDDDQSEAEREIEADEERLAGPATLEAADDESEDDQDDADADADADDEAGDGETDDIEDDEDEAEPKAESDPSDDDDKTA